MGLTNRFIKRSFSLNVIKVTDVDDSAIKKRDECVFYIMIHKFTTANRAEIYSTYELI